MITKTQKGLSLILFLVVLLLIFDNNCFKRKPVTIVVASKEVELSGGSKPSSSGHSTEFIRDRDGNKYKVPPFLFTYYHIGDSLSVIRSLIFHKAIRIGSSRDGEYKKENIGVLNSDPFSITLSIIPLLLCIITIFFDHLLKKEVQKMAVISLSVLLTVVIIAFYFIFST